MKMNSIKTFVFAACACTAIGAFADAANTLITFSTPGPDTYADGETVKDGEIYALVWSADGNFDGFTAQGEAADANDKVFFKAPLAKDGKCGLTLFQIDSKVAPQGGEYAVYLLDTRAGNGPVTGAAVAKTFGGASGTANIAVAKTDNTVDAEGNAVAVSTGTAALTGDVAAIAPVIKGIKVNGATVKITVGNILPGLVYEVKGGLKGDADLTGTTAEKVGEDVEFTVPAQGAQFFKVQAK